MVRMVYIRGGLVLLCFVLLCVATLGGADSAEAAPLDPTPTPGYDWPIPTIEPLAGIKSELGMPDSFSDDTDMSTFLWDLSNWGKVITGGLGVQWFIINRAGYLYAAGLLFAVMLGVVSMIVKGVIGNIGSLLSGPTQSQQFEEILYDYTGDLDDPLMADAVGDPNDWSAEERDLGGAVQRMLIALTRRRIRD